MRQKISVENISELECDFCDYREKEALWIERIDDRMINQNDMLSVCRPCAEELATKLQEALKENK